MENIWYRNPQTGRFETHELSARLPYLSWVRNPQGGIVTDPTSGKGQLKEFAADSALAILRIADPVQTTLVQGYGLPETIGDKYFTPVRMEKESGRFPAFGKEAFYIPSSLKRALGGRVNRLVTQSGYVQMALSEYAEGVAIDNRERNEWAGAPDLLITSKLNTVTSRVARLREKNQATLLTTAGSYGTGLAVSGAGKAWATSGDPVADYLDMILAVRKTVGQRPNKAWATPTAWRLIVTNASVRRQMKNYYGAGELPTPALIKQAAFAALIEVEEFNVGYATYSTDTAASITDGAVLSAAPTDGYIWESVYASAAGVTVVGTGGGIEPAFG